MRVFFLGSGLLGLAVTWNVGCGSEVTDAKNSPDVSNQAAVFIDTERNSVDGDTALRNLSAQIDGKRSAVASNPKSMPFRRDLVALLLRRAGFTGSYSDFEEADEVSEEALARNPKDKDAVLARAQFLSAVHRFREAKELWNGAQEKALGIDEEETIVLEATHAIATTGELESVTSAIEKLAKENPSYSSLGTLGAMQGALGDFEDADQSYLEALASYKNVSPFPFAYIAFERGVMWAERADAPSLGVALYEEAIRRVPDYVVANTHLAELEANEENRPQDAIDRLERTASFTEDPEPLGLLAALLQRNDIGESQDKERAKELIREATKRYNKLLERYPLAFADHASEFFADPAAGNNSAKAVELAEANLSNRKNARAYIVAIEAYLSAGNEERSCALAEESEELREQTPALDSLIGSLEGC